MSAETKKVSFVVTKQRDRVVATANRVATVVSCGAQGPRGPQGDGGDGFIFVASSPVGGHRILALNDLGEVVYADNQSPIDSARIIGMSLNAASVGGEVSVKRSGSVSEPSWNFDTSLPVYLGSNGTLTQIAPEAPAVFSLIVGFPETATRIFIAIREPINLGA